LETKTLYLNNINYFRGVAIVFIVFGHCTGFGITSFYDNTTLLAKEIKFIANGGTTFFVFISGFLLHHIYHGKYYLKSFVNNKIKYVFLPFLFFSSVDIIYYITRFLISYSLLSGNYHIYIDKILSLDLIKIYLVGHSEIAIGLWYVPFIMVMFSVSGFFMKFADMNLKIQLCTICILIFLSLIIHRSIDGRIIGIFQNVIYFTPVYLSGIFMSANRKLFYSKMVGKEFYFLISALIIAIMQVRIGDLVAFKDSNLIGFKIFDLMLLQKLSLSIFFVLYLRRFEQKKIKILDILASHSFGIFFIHGVFIWLINNIVFKLKISFRSDSIIVYVTSASLVLAISLFTTIVFKRLFPVRSRVLIGC
jgi:surface polysaccharide O-acyltransferase-like enzyme